MSDCESSAPDIISDDQIGVCKGSCGDNCLENCDCFVVLVDRNWQPDLQDYATSVHAFRSI